MFLKPLQSLLHPRRFTKLIPPICANFSTLSPPESSFRSLIKLCRRVEDLNPLKSLLIVSGSIDFKLVISEFAHRCFDLGHPELALSSFCASRNRSLLLQNSLIKRLSNLGLHRNVIFVFEKCRLLGCYTFPYVIKACSALRDVELGKEVHCVVLRSGYGRNVVVQTALVDFYAKIGRVDVARKVFDEMSEWDVVAWNALISGYSLNGLDYDAFDVFFDIWLKGVKPNASTLSSIVPVCTRLRLLNLGESLHCYAVKSGFDQNELLIPALISMHASTGNICAAQHLFESSVTKDLVIWNSTIHAFTQNHHPQRAFEMFSEMVSAHLHPNTVTFVSVIPSCEKMNSIHHGECLHGCTIKYGLDNQVPIATALITMYAKLGDINSAIHIFTLMPKRNRLTWNSMISGYVHHGLLHTSLEAGREMQLAGFEPDSISIINVLSACSELESLLLGKSAHAVSLRKGFDSNTNVLNILLAFYSNCHQLHTSWKLFDRTADKNTVSWNTMISGCVHNGQVENATTLVRKMQREAGQKLDVVTLVSILPGLNDPGSLFLGLALHGFALKFGWTSDVTLTNALITMYCNCGEPDSGALLFHDLEATKARTLVSWNSLITGYRSHNLHEEALFLFRQLTRSGKKPNYITLLNVLPACPSILEGKSIHAYAIRSGEPQETPLLTSLISMYSKFNRVASCISIFNPVEKRDISLWNSMMSALINARNPQRVFALFVELLQTEVKMDHVTVLSLVSACTLINNIFTTNSVLGFVIKAGLCHDTAISNALVDSCAKCGDILTAESVFDAMAHKDAVSWSVMINSYGLQGDAYAAISLLKQMENSGVTPDGVTYLGVLSACSHSGLTNEIKTVFDSMVSVHGIEPTAEHYGCILDLLGRTGRLKEAYDIVEKLPSDSMLESLLGACMVHGNSILGEKIGKLLVERDPENARVYVMLGNIYADAGRWHEADKMRIQMEGRQLKKVAGFSMNA